MIKLCNYQFECSLIVIFVLIECENDNFLNNEGILIKLYIKKLRYISERNFQIINLEFRRNEER